jgi:hypothetical protein
MSLGWLWLADEDFLVTCLSQSFFLAASRLS